MPTVSDPPGSYPALRSKVTTKSQTTLPSGVRKALGIAPGDELEYVIEGDRAIVRKAEETEGHDPALGPFLDLLEQEIMQHPERLQTMPRDLLARMREIAAGVRVDHNERIDGAVAL